MNNEPKRCPTCGKPMRIQSDEHTPRRRWVCGDWLRIGADCCLTSQPIPDDERLDVRTIARDMARSREILMGSKERRKEQVNLRKLAGGLRRQHQTQKYLSDPERGTLAEAAEILERVATATEKANKELKRIEEERRLEHERRTRTRRLALADDFLRDIDDRVAIERCEALDDYIKQATGYRPCLARDACAASEAHGGPAPDEAQLRFRLHLGRVIDEELNAGWRELSLVGFATFHAQWREQKQHETAIEDTANVVQLCHTKTAR